ncbi:integral membrane [Pyrenophora seminiperda CCB06]|uniref:Integral membrane n=1 Tax=Pyrenophora seminiperda CCB06 TaxID=1302712 RepID=A0A3M7MFW7_9PLEO|nr:integral membrane [Pyrenophora seminiperda CCB06]
MRTAIEISTMHVTSLLPLFIVATGIAAAPTPLHPVARAVPNILDVARNPAPINGKVHWEHGRPYVNDVGDMKPEDREELEEIVHHLGGRYANVGPFIDVVTWILLITSALAVLTRLITKRALRRSFDIDDTFVVLALVRFSDNITQFLSCCADVVNSKITSIGSGAAVSVQTAYGLGRDVSLLTENQILVYQKADYANKALYIATLALAKLSIISLLMILTASKFHRNIGLGLTGFIALWGVLSVIVSALQCGKFEPWRFLGVNEKCFHVTSFWQCMGVLNVVTDLALILFPVHVIMTLQMSLSKKVTILTFFGARSLYVVYYVASPHKLTTYSDIIATAVQMVYISGFESRNPTKDLWKWTLITQIIECITILTSCVPYLRPLLESVPSGLYGTDELRRRGTSSEHGYSRSKSGSYQLSSSPSRVTGTRHSRRSQIEGGGIKRFLPMLSQERTTYTNSASGIPGGPRRLDGEMDVETTAVHHKHGDEKRWNDKRWETASTGSHSKILKTTVVSAEWEEAEVKSPDGSWDEIEVVR